MSNIARGQITISNLDNEHTFIKWSDDAKTIKFDNPNYREVDYIQNTYRYYFYVPYSDVGQIGNDTRIVIDFKLMGYPNSNYSPYIFGCYQSGKWFYMLRYNATSKNLWVRIVPSDYDADTVNNYTINIPYTLRTRIKVDISTERVIVNDTDVYYFPEEAVMTPFQYNYSMRYFMGTNGTTVAGNNYYAYCNIYNIKVYKAGELRANLIPVVRLNAESKGVTMYNTVLNKIGIAWSTANHQYLMYPSATKGVNLILNGNFQDDLKYWDTSKIGENMTCDIVNDDVKGKSLHFISTNTDTIDESTNTVYQYQNGTATAPANRYFNRYDYLNGGKTFVSFDAKADVDNSTLTVIRRNDSSFNGTTTFTLTDQWKRYVWEKSDTAATSVNNTLGFAPSDPDVNYYITNIKVEYGDEYTGYSECPDDKDTYQTTGKYMGTLVWSNDYPSDNFEDYTWVKVEGTDGVDGTDGDSGDDAEFYQLSAVREKAVVNSSGTLGLDFQYYIEHVKGNNIDTVATSSDGLHVALIPDYGNTINCSVGSTISTYTNASYFPNYHTETNKPTSIQVVLLNGIDIIYRKYIQVVFEADATLKITDSINATVQGHTTVLNNLEVGGRNLIQDSTFDNVSTKWNDWGEVDREYVTEDGIKYLHIETDDHWQGIQQSVYNRWGSITKELLPNKYYTFSADVYGQGKFHFIIHFRNQEQVNLSQYAESFDLTSTPRRIHSTFLVPNDASIHHFNIMIGSTYDVSDIYVGRPQLEIGTLPTAWKKAPEDEDAAINGVVNQISQLNIDVDGISTLVQQVKQDVYEDTNNVFGITSYNGGDLGNRNTWALDSNGVTIENTYGYRNLLLYRGTADWFNRSSGTSYLYTPYFNVTNSQMYTLNCSLLPMSSDWAIQLVYYPSWLNARDFVNGTAENIITGTYEDTLTIDQVTRFVTNTNSTKGFYCRLRFCNITQEYDEDMDDYNIVVSKVRLYKGTKQATDFPAWNELYSKAFSSIQQNANEIKLQVDDINLRIDNQQIELNGDTVVNGALTLTDEDTGFVLQGEGTTQISPKSIGTYADFSQNATNAVLVHLSNTTYAAKEVTGKYEASLNFNYTLGQLDANTTIALKNHLLSLTMQGSGTMSIYYLTCSYKIYEDNVLKTTKTTSSTSTATVGSYTTSAQANIRIAVTVDAVLTINNYTGMTEPKIKGILDYAVQVSTDSFMLMGYDGLAVNFGNNKTAYIGSEGTIINYGNYGIKITNTGLQKYDYNAWVGLNNKHINNVVSNAYTVQETDDFIVYSGTSNCTITLPTNLTRGKIVYIKSTSSATVTVSSSANIYPTDSRTAASSRSIANKMSFYIWNGTNWYEGQ